MTFSGQAVTTVTAAAAGTGRMREEGWGDRSEGSGEDRGEWRRRD